MSENTVSREKYLIIKKKAQKWQEAAIQYKEKYEEFVEQNERLSLEIDEINFDNKNIYEDDLEQLRNENHVLDQENTILRNKVEKYKQRYKEKLKEYDNVKKQIEEQEFMDKMARHISQKQNMLKDT